MHTANSPTDSDTTVNKKTMYAPLTSRQRWLTMPTLAAAMVIGAAATAQAAITETVTYYHSDAAGSPVAATDESGSVVWRQVHLPYGERDVPALTPEEESTSFTGKHLDAETGLQYFGARDYDPMLGRFTGIDPVGFQQANVQTFNRYAYANNNPYRYVDPDGRAALAMGGAGAGCALTGPFCPIGAAGGFILGTVATIAIVIIADHHLNEQADGGSSDAGADAENGSREPKIHERPSRWRKKTVEEVWEAADEGSEPGTRTCSTCDEEATVAPGEGPRDWDIDHDPKLKDRPPAPDRKKFLDDYNDTSKLRLRCPTCNRSDNQ